MSTFEIINHLAVDEATGSTTMFVQNTVLPTSQASLVVADLADAAAARHVFANYRQHRATETLRRQDGDLRVVWARRVGS